ncbi:Site-specific recombinase XerD [Rathayibacter rathayi NCPPB 2980 = VKM Ac-1601]|uniref:tyrosine-type recombinase/integrase n=1 Tax=Rathayibacter rathayi TaxID=33887 RepID=UPI000BDB2A29|nr:site-specific integrase [Rathayibacter rathayi]TWD70316.1 site-specific recombinase XerD [Rathayibacter rathayi]SOE04988.1 Site-specific recombinase XerD [Rathayibacter rathayi NCPPB 2980 = VKM Ac-1601]
MAFVRKTDAGRWRGIAKRGRVVLGSRTFDLRRDAIAWAERTEAQAVGGVDLRAGKVLIRDLLPEWLEHRRATVTPQAAATDGQLIRLMSPSLGARAVASVLPVDVERWYVYLRQHQHQSDGSMKRYRGSLSAFFAWCIAEGRTAQNPVTASRLPAPVGPPSEMRPLSEADLFDVVEKVRARCEHCADLVTVLAWTGARFGEARELRVKDVSEQPTPSLRVARSRSEGEPVKSTKGRRVRRVPLAEPAWAIVRELMRLKRPDDLLLTGEHGGQLWRSQFLRSSGFTEASGGRRIHDLRHTFATLALARGVDLATVSKWLGHGSVSITDRYMHYLGTQADMAGLALLNSGGGAPGVRVDESEAGL